MKKKKAGERERVKQLSRRGEEKAPVKEIWRTLRGSRGGENERKKKGRQWVLQWMVTTQHTKGYT